MPLEGASNTSHWLVSGLAWLKRGPRNPIAAWLLLAIIGTLIGHFAFGEAWNRSAPSSVVVAFVLVIGMRVFRGRGEESYGRALRRTPLPPPRSRDEAARAAGGVMSRGSGGQQRDGSRQTALRAPMGDSPPRNQ